MTSAHPSLGLFGGKAGHIHPRPEAHGVPAGGRRQWVNQALAPGAKFKGGARKLKPLLRRVYFNTTV